MSSGGFIKSKTNPPGRTLNGSSLNRSSSMSIKVSGSPLVSIPIMPSVDRVFIVIDQSFSLVIKYYREYSFTLLIRSITNILCNELLTEPLFSIVQQRFSSIKKANDYEENIRLIT